MREKREAKTRALLSAARRGPRQRKELDKRAIPPSEASQPSSPGRQLEAIARAREIRFSMEEEQEEEENLKRYWR